MVRRYRITRVISSILLFASLLLSLLALFAGYKEDFMESYDVVRVCQTQLVLTQVMTNSLCNSLIPR
jgi:hypothetical protein